MSEKDQPPGAPAGPSSWLEALARQTETSARLRGQLQAFTGGGPIYRHQINHSFVYTEGFRHFLRYAGGGAYWFADILATQPEIARALSANATMLAILNVDCGVGTLVVARDRCGRDEYVDAAYTQHISLTDCPPGEWLFRLVPGIDPQDRRVILAGLPSEF